MLRKTVPIVDSTMGGALRSMEKAQDGSDIIELRIDYMTDPDLGRLLSASGLPKIVTCRTPYEGGHFKGPEECRAAYLQEACDLGAEYVDVELEHYHDLRRGLETKLIVSNHNFDETTQDLDDILRRIKEMGADVPKMAMMANSYDDSLRMLDLVERYDGEDGMIGICMGRYGVITRVLGPVYGGHLTFVSLPGSPSAPGQLTIPEYNKASKILGLLLGEEPPAPKNMLKADFQKVGEVLTLALEDVA